MLPYIGGALAAGPAVLSALVHGPTVALVVLAVLLLYQEFENRFLVPRIYGNALHLPSAVVIIALVVGGKLLGILGALLALPVASGVRMIVEELRVELPGDVADDPSLKKRDRRGEAEYQARADGVGAVEAAAIATEIAATRWSSTRRPCLRRTVGRGKNAVNRLRRTTLNPPSKLRRSVLNSPLHRSRPTDNPHFLDERLPARRHPADASRLIPSESINCAAEALGPHQPSSFEGSARVSQVGTKQAPLRLVTFGPTSADIVSDPSLFLCRALL